MERETKEDAHTVHSTLILNFYTELMQRSTKQEMGKGKERTFLGNEKYNFHLN